ncbi:MAG TPA: response regulator [Magnetospirillaceae bacterium]|nr:response regulator [Magnetospirillaceae bacterium]
MTESGVIGVAAGSVPKIKVPILIVDDKPQNLLVLADLLAPLGEEIIQAQSGKEALRVLLQREVAIILLDVQMPDIDGYELAGLVRQRERSRSTPIIFITAHDRDSEEITKGYALGAVDYVFKPVAPVILRAKVSVFVDLFRKTLAAKEQAAMERILLSENLRVRTEKIEAEMALRQVEERQALIVRSLPIALYTAELGTHFSGPRFLSESMAEQVGFEPAQFIEDRDLWASRINPADLPQLRAALQNIQLIGTTSMEYRWRCADGSERVFLDQAVLVRDDEGKPKDIFGTCLDVTERRILEAQLIQSQKMEAIGLLMGGIAHDFNNMLSVIIWNLDLLARDLKLAGGKNHERTQNALGGALNCTELIRQLLDFAREKPRRAEVVELTEVVPRLARMLGSVMGETVSIDIKLAPDLWRTFVDPAQIESALVNLAVNGRDAMAETGGTLTIEAVNVEHEDKSLEGDCVMLAVTDTGTGMDPAVAERAFEPFFTTKGPGQGTGLGLAMVYGFVKQSGGRIKIESAPGQGTSVKLFLPRTDAKVKSDSEAEAALPVLSRRRILIVEDNENVRRMAVSRLEELGHEIVEAESPPKALEILEQDTGIELLFTDIVMPGGVNGFDLAHKATERRPELKVIFVSGYAPSLYAGEGLKQEFLMKPYSEEELVRALHAAFVEPAQTTERETRRGRAAARRRG